MHWTRKDIEGWTDRDIAGDLRRHLLCESHCLSMCICFFLLPSIMIVLIAHVGQAPAAVPLKISACVSSGQLSSDYGTPGNTVCTVETSFPSRLGPAIEPRPGHRRMTIIVLSTLWSRLGLTLRTKFARHLKYDLSLTFSIIGGSRVWESSTSPLNP